MQTSLGLHPQVAHERHTEIGLFERLIKEVKYVGKIGLDKSQHFKQHFEIQLQVFSKIVAIVENSGGRVMSIHSRNAVPEVLKILNNHPNSGPAILHWFSGSKPQLSQAIDQRCWFSIGPKMLESKKGIELIKMMPFDKLLFETDGPFATSNKGIPYEPVDTLRLPELLSPILQKPATIIKKQILQNFRNLSSYKIRNRFQ